MCHGSSNRSLKVHVKVVWSQEGDQHQETQSTVKLVLEQIFFLIAESQERYKQSVFLTGIGRVFRFWSVPNLLLPFANAYCLME